MNKPAKLCYRAWAKPEILLTLLDWRPHEGLAFVLDADKRRQVIRYVAPGPLALGGMGAGVVFPKAAPATITETWLLPPPCRTTEQEAECLRAAAAELRSPNNQTKSRNPTNFLNWELIWLRHRNDILLPAPEDDAALAERLGVFKVNQRRAYDARRQELEEWRTKTIGQMIYLGGGRFYRELRNCKPASMTERVERELSMLETTFTSPLKEFMGRLHGGCLNWTLEVARHEPMIRDPVLHERWAAQNHLELAEIHAEKEAFLRWYRAHYPTPMRRAPDKFLEALAPGVSAATADGALCAEVRFVADFQDGSRMWLADCPRRDPLLTAEEQRAFESPVPLMSAGQSLDTAAVHTAHISAALAAAEIVTKAGRVARADAEAGASTLGERTRDLAAERLRLEAVPDKLAVEGRRIDAATDQLAAKATALDAVIAPLNRLYAEVELAEIRKRAIGQAVPDLFVDWVLSRFQSSNPPRLPTKGDAYNNCGPGTLIGKKLERAGVGISKQRFADHLTVLRRLLELKGWLAPLDSGKSRKRASNFQPDDRLEDHNQPNPAESAEDRDEERRKTATSDTKLEDSEEPNGDAS